MSLTHQDVAQIAKLARIAVTEQEIEAVGHELNTIFGLIEKMQAVNTDGVEPMAQVSDRHGVDESKQGSERFAYASREDVPEGLRKSLSQESALENAPDADGTFFRVPKVIER